MEHEVRIEKIYKLITELASGNFSYREEPTSNHDELDGIIVGINMLAEELQDTTVSKDALMRIYKGVVDMMLVLNLDFIIQNVNDAFLKRLNYKGKNVVGKPIEDFFIEGTSFKITKIKASLPRKRELHDIEMLVKPKRGKAIFVSVSCSILTDANNQPNGYLFIAKDISRVKDVEEQLRIKNHELNTFIYRASHDLKGPLASILGLTILAKLPDTTPEQLLSYIDMIDKRVKKLDSILLNLLQLGKITEMDYKLDMVHFESLLKDVLKSYEFSTEYKKVKRILKVEVKDPVLIRVNLLQAIFQNLIENAFKYSDLTKPSPFVKIKICETGNNYKMVVSDNGIGIPAEIQPRIFDIFFRGTGQSQGSGLGLYLVKASVEALKGEIEVHSNFNEGTTFTITIPKPKNNSLKSLNI